MANDASPTATAAIKWRAVFAAVAAISVVGTAIGFGMPLLSIILESRGYSATLIGANTATAGIAAIATAPVATRIAAKLGFVRTMLAMLLLAGVSAPGFYFSEALSMWFLLRFTLHVALTMLFILSEFWIVDSAPAHRRGLVLGIYATVLSIGFATGPWLLSITGSTGFLPFAVITALLVAAAGPVFLAKNQPPAMHASAQARVFTSFLFAAPAATAAVFVFGAVETGGLSLLPIYGQQTGYSEAEAALLISMLGLGNVALQIPIGLLADRVADKRFLLAACAAIGLAGSLLLIRFSGNWTATAIVLFIWGGGVAGLYTVGLAHLSAKLDGLDLASANAAFIFCYALGMLAGPQLMGFGMDYSGPDGFARVLAAFFVAYIVFVASRMVVSRQHT